jgi:hypothetical protein
VSNRVSRRQAGRWAEQDQQAYAAAPPPAAPPPPAAAPATDMDTKLGLLKELGELKEQGVLSELEFEQQKARILSS